MTAHPDAGEMDLVRELAVPWDDLDRAPWEPRSRRLGWIHEPSKSLGDTVKARARRAATGACLVGADVLAFLLVLSLTDIGFTAASAGWLALTAALLTQAGGYRIRLTYSLLDDAPTIIGRCVAAGAVVAAAVRPEWASSPAVGLRSLLLMGASLLVLRGLAYTGVRLLRRHRVVEHRTLIVGAGVVGAQIARITQDHPEFGLRAVGFLDPHPLTPEKDLRVPVLGGTDALAQMIRKHEVDHVIMAFVQAPESAAVDLIRTCDRLECEIFFVPRLFELSAMHSTMEQLLGLPLVRLRRATFRSVGWRLKRAVDIAFAAVALLVLGLPMLGIAALLRLTQGPGVLFHQERLGLDGRSFRLMKFRTLRPDSSTESDTRWSIARDDRLSPLATFLRRWSLDELPQLLNVLRGDMSLVGPRPERPHFVALFADSFPRYVARHRVPCGLTGWAQIHGLRGDTSIPERVRFDNHYIENWSLWLDAKILVRTLFSFRSSA